MGFLTVTENVWTRIFIKTSKCLSSEKKKFGRYFIMFTAGQEDDMKASLGHFIFKKKLGRSSTNVVLIGKLLNCFRSFGWG